MAQKWSRKYETFHETEYISPEFIDFIFGCAETDGALVEKPKPYRKMKPALNETSIVFTICKALNALA